MYYYTSITDGHNRDIMCYDILYIVTYNQVKNHNYAYKNTKYTVIICYGMYN